MKFSIITVSRNNAATIGKTIASVQSQTWPEVEHVMIDGSSSDGTQALISSSLRSCDKFISEPDAGIYDAMNKGLALATGDVIGLLNADDHYPHQDVLKRVAEQFENGPTDCVYGNVAFFAAESPDKTIRHYNSGSFTPARLAMGLMPAHPATFYRRLTYQRVGRFKTDYRIAADFEFTVRAFWKTGLRASYLPETLVKMQQGGVSSAGWRSKLILNREILRALRENGVPSSPFHLAAKVPFRLMELW
jgi:glycosyltransferase involved in cell wall biosynthesis